MNGADKLKQWVKINPWLPVMVTTVIWVGTQFLQSGGNVQVLSWAAGCAVAAAVALLAAVKIADFVSRGETEAVRRQRARNIAIGLALAGMAVLFYVATLVRLGGNALNRAI